MDTFSFKGTVTFRSSKPGATGPVGEAELFRINPQREVKLCACTGWNKLEPGSLNLHVEDGVVERLGDMCELYFEHPSLIKYPNGKSKIPERRGGYLYYRAFVGISEPMKPALIRRAKNKPLLDLVEAYAPVRLVDVLGLREGTVVEVKRLREHVRGRVVDLSPLLHGHGKASVAMAPGEGAAR